MGYNYYILIIFIIKTFIQITLCLKQDGAHLDSQYFKELHGIGIKQCSKRCYAEKNCRSINFSKLKFTCTLSYDDNGERQLVQDSDFIYMDRSYMSKYFPASVDCPDHNVLLTMHDDRSRCFQKFWCDTITRLDWENNAELTVHASSVYSAGLNVQGIDGPSGWCVRSLASITSDYVQFQFSKPYEVHGVMTQSRQIYHQWIASYKVQSSSDTVQWTQIGNDYIGNTQFNTKVTNNLSIPVKTKYLRIVPVTYYGFACARFDLIGCAVL